MYTLLREVILIFVFVCLLNNCHSHTVYVTYGNTLVDRWSFENVTLEFSKVVQKPGAA